MILSRNLASALYVISVVCRRLSKSQFYLHYQGIFSSDTLFRLFKWQRVMSQQDLKKQRAWHPPTCDGGANDGTTRHKGRGVFCVGSAERNVPTWNRNADIFQERRRRRRIVAGNTDERAWLLSNSKARQERDATYITLLSRAKLSLPSFANPRVIHATPVPLSAWAIFR